MNRPLLADEYAIGIQPARISQLSASTDDLSQRSGLLELLRRFSGLVAVAVLGITMTVLAFRNEDAATPQAVAAPAVAPAMEPTAVPKLSSRYSTYPDYTKTVAYYLYDTEEQRDDLMLAEALAAQEIATGMITSDREFYALFAASPEEEEVARDVIFQAMLEKDPGAQVVVVDVRQPPTTP